jgi:hypothetical protein
MSKFQECNYLSHLSLPKSQECIWIRSSCCLNQMDLVGIDFDSSLKPSKLLKQMVFGGQQESLVQSVSVPMPEAIQAVKQVEVVFSGQQDKSSSQYTTNRVW